MTEFIAMLNRGKLLPRIFVWRKAGGISGALGLRTNHEPSSSGEIQYRQRMEDIRLLKLEIKKLRREKHILTKSVANVEELG